MQDAPMAATGTRLDLAALRIGAILNTASGQCDAAAEAEITQHIAAANPAFSRVWCGGPEELAGYLEEAKEERLDVLVVLGGDGTIRSAAELADPEGPYLLPLPGGTMNMLPTALYGARPWRDILRDTLAAPVLRNVSCGKIDDEEFYCAALFGASTRLTAAREAVRDGAVGDALAIAGQVVAEAPTAVLAYEFGKKASGEAQTVAITCPLVSDAMHPEEAVLEAAAFVTPGVGEALGIAVAGAFGTWRDDPNVVVAKADRITLTNTEHIPATLDGEQIMLPETVRIEFVPQAFKAVVPESSLT